MTIARRQVLVQLNDSLLALLDERAARLRVSRSQLVREAIERYVAADRDAEIDRAIVEGYTRMPQEIDPWADAALDESLADRPW